MSAEWLVRFALGGAIVSMFSVIGEVVHPKTFAGMFGAAPSVAIASLILAYSHETQAYVAAECRSMMIGGAGLFTYAAACVAVGRRPRIPIWVGASLSWLAWLAVSLGFWGLLRVLSGAT